MIKAIVVDNIETSYEPMYVVRCEEGSTWMIDANAIKAGCELFSPYTGESVQLVLHLGDQQSIIL